jgi:hypothetical protein
VRTVKAEAEVLVSKLVHASGEATRDHIFSRTDIPSVVSFEVLPIRCYAGGDTLHPDDVKAEWGLLKCVPSASQTTTRVTLTVARQGFSR